MQYKICNKCGVKKSEEDFPMESGRAYRKTTCRLCIRSVAKVRKELRDTVEPPPEDYQ